MADCLLCDLFNPCLYMYILYLNVSIRNISVPCQPKEHTTHHHSSIDVVYIYVGMSVRIGTYMYLSVPERIYPYRWHVA